ncbi:MAG: hypothetical protein MRY83_07035 [Flavobacteriales bacterium]|nr:hypothetical protein [Flavobacteriales bacterium]
MKSYILVFALLLAISASGSRNTFDSIIKELPGITDKLKKADLYLEAGRLAVNYLPDSSAHFIAKARQIFQVEDDTLGLAKSDLYLAHKIFVINHNIDSAKRLIEKSLIVFEEQGNMKFIMLAQRKLSRCLVIEGKTEEALEFGFKAVDYYQSQNDSFQTGKALSDIAVTFMHIDKWEKALEYNLKSKAYLEHYPNELQVYTNTGSCYMVLGRLQECKNIYEEAEIKARNSNNILTLADILGNLGIIWVELGEPQKSIQYLKEASAMCLKINNMTSYFTSMYGLANAYLETNRLKEGELILKEILDRIAEKDGRDILNFKREVHYALYRNYKRQNNSYAALEQHERFYVIADSLLKMASNDKVIGLEKKYQSEKKDAEIALLNEQKITADLELQNKAIKERNMYIIIFILGILLLSISLLYTRIRKLAKSLDARAKELELALHQNDLLLKETHHRVKNNLQMISSLLNLQSNKESNPSVLNALNEGKNRVKSVALIHEKLYKNKDLSAIDFKEYSENLIDHLVHLSNEKMPVVDLQIPNNTFVDMDTAIPLGLILNELITNSQKHAFKHNKEPRITISFLTDKNGFHVLKYSDSGPGIPGQLEAKRNSLGIKLILMLSRQLDASVTKIDEPWSISIKFESKSMKLAA